MARTRILLAFGTRPEAIKMFPLVDALRQRSEFELRVAVTAQHRKLLDQVLDFAKIEPDHDLNLMQANQTLDGLAARILAGFGQVLDQAMPDRVLVHGDTLTTMMAVLACYFRKIPVGHVEAGLRSGDIYAPWPEEVNRKIAGAVADLHFAPTSAAADALRRENINPATIHMTGNTVIDALLHTRAEIAKNPSLTSALDPIAARFFGKRIIAVTAHRRENLGHGMHQIAAALRQLAKRDDIAIIFPLHPNPGVAKVMRAELENVSDIALVDPLDYPSFVGMMDMSTLILTDSGGVQEEAPSLGKPVLVMRERSERPEGIEAGTARLVGTDPRMIVQEVDRLLDNPVYFQSMSRAHNPYGDGEAAIRIADILARTHSRKIPIAAE